MNTIRNTLLLLSSVVLFACTSSKPISTNKFEGHSRIVEGEIATMKWDFANAKNVKVDLYDKVFHPIDSAKVSPSKTKEYKITAYHESDTVAYKWLVEVVNRNDNQNKLVDSTKVTESEVKTSPDLPTYVPNNTNSQFINGSIGPEAAPVRIKIMQSAVQDKKLELNTIILDENGNFINGLNSKVVDMSFIQSCNKSSTSSGDLQTQEIHKTNGTDYSIVFDNSAVAEFNFPLLDRILSFSESLSAKDQIMFSYFNQNYNEYIGLKGQKEFYDQFQNYDLPKPSGLSGIYKALYNNLLDFTKLVSKDKNKALILFTYSEDNSSLIYSPDDIINAAQNFGIPIYVVAIGDAYNSYSMQKIANSTGGKLYKVDADSTHLAELILKEIDFALNNHYSVTMEYDSNNKDCADSYGKLILKYGDKTIDDGIVLNPTKNDFHSYYQSVAIFEPNSSEIDKSFDSNIAELSNVLKNNPDYQVKLIGHSGDEGSKEFDAKISESRADNIKQKLVKNGVSENQIITESEGFSKPLYLLGQSPWQNNFNRRVELRWVNPSNASPFEIIVEQVWTEEEAYNSVNKWVKRGYKAYFDNYLIGTEPVYRVMLWGFKNEEDAKSNASKIIKKYKTTVTYK